MISVKDLQEKGICPTCYNFEHGGVYNDFTDRMLYEDDILYCFLEERPRSIGHTIILIKEHYNDMSYIPQAICEHTFDVARRMMNVLKESLGVERVYLCTMCDGEVNHFHVQLIPRYPNEQIGSTNFVKVRKEYVEDKALIKKITKEINNMF